MNESKKALWEKHFQEHERSGMSVDIWCRANHISKHKFYYWKKCIQQEDPAASQTTTPVFAELALKSPLMESVDTAASAGLHIQWKEFSFILTDTDSVRIAAEFIELLRQP